jgi:hypothetical protein
MLCYFIGDRTLDDCRQFFKEMVDRIENIPVFTSDELPHYEDSILEMFHHVITPEPTGKRGRPQEPYKEILPEIDYATIHKTRENGRIVSVEKKVKFGDEGRIVDRLKNTPSVTINTSFVERTNTNWRLWDAHLTRKGLTFAKSLRWLKAKFAIVVAVYNFVRPHESLSRDRVTRKFCAKTPAMAAGVTNFQWSINHLLWYPS